MLKSIIYLSGKMSIDQKIREVWGVGLRYNEHLFTLLWKLENEKGVWQDLVRNKYLRKCTLRNSRSKPGQSHFWQGLMKGKPIFCSIVGRWRAMRKGLCFGMMFG